MLAQPIKIFIADDDPDARDLLAHQLNDNDFDLQFFRNAETLLKRLKSGNVSNCDVILLDMNMPGGMNGLDCLQIIKSMPEYHNIPVVLQTSDNTPDIVTRILRSGAFYFLEKTTERNVIRAVLYSAMESKMRFQEVEKERKTLKSGLAYVEQAKFRIRTLDDMNTMTAMLSSAYPDPDAVTVGIHELLTNAIEHGNLGITYEGKSQLILVDKWKDEVERRLNLDENRHKSVEIELVKSPTQITLTITDQGNGFNCESYLEIDPCRLFDPHGRGIAVAKSMSFDDLIYIGCGNTVQATVNL